MEKRIHIRHQHAMVQSRLLCRLRATAVGHTHTHTPSLFASVFMCTDGLSFEDVAGRDGGVVGWCCCCWCCCLCVGREAVWRQATVLLLLLLFLAAAVAYSRGARRWKGYIGLQSEDKELQEWQSKNNKAKENAGNFADDGDDDDFAGIDDADDGGEDEIIFKSSVDNLNKV
jgi:hypothetical protein